MGMWVYIRHTILFFIQITMQTFYELDTWDWQILIREVNEEWVKVRDNVVDTVWVSEELENAGSFYSTIGRALLYADMYNRQKLLKAFEDRILQACLQIKDKWKELD